MAGPQEAGSYVIAAGRPQSAGRFARMLPKTTNITSAMALMGTIAGATRAGGPTWPMAVIHWKSLGNRAVAEAKLRNSTSSEACELWNG